MVVLESLRHQTVRNSDSLQSNFYKELQWPDFPVLHCVLEFPLTHVRCVMPSNCLILCSPLLLLPSIFPNIWFFSNESAFRIRWQKYWSFSTSSSNEYSELISISIDWFDPPCCPRDSESLHQHHSSKTSILQRWAFFFFFFNLNLFILIGG